VTAPPGGCPSERPSVRAGRDRGVSAAARRSLGACVCLVTLVLSAVSAAAQTVPAHRTRSITDRSVRWPTSDQWLRLLTLRDYNTRLVLLGSTMLGAAAGVVGSFLLLRRRALLGDALSHAMFPGIAIAFLVGEAAGGYGKSLPVLMAGAACTAALGAGLILLIRHSSRIKEDAALGIVLSVLFGAGAAVLGVVQRTGRGHSAGLESFVYGRTASMVDSDTLLIGAISILVLLMTGLLFKELKVLCFDEGYARSQGWPIVLLDGLLMALVVAVTLVGLQAVGLILVIALLITPAAAARFWTERLSLMVLVAALLGALSALVGAAMSALLPNLPSGAMIVLVAAGLFVISLLGGPARGVAVGALRRRAFTRKVARQHLLRALFESLEAVLPPPDATAARVSADTDRGEPGGASQRARDTSSPPVSLDALLSARSWSPAHLRRGVRRAERDGLLWLDAAARAVRLTPAGLREARRITREHRLWEMFLITPADVAPSHVDRDADMIEHVLSPQLIAELDGLVAAHRARPGMPASPHALAVTTGQAAAKARPS
jgi:manganese/zinc/iron transport system permease protein